MDTQVTSFCLIFSMLYQRGSELGYSTKIPRKSDLKYLRAKKWCIFFSIFDFVYMASASYYSSDSDCVGVLGPAVSR